MYGNDMNMGFVQPQERPKPRIGIVIFAIIVSLAIGAGAMYAYFKLANPQNKCKDEPAVTEEKKEEESTEKKDESVTYEKAAYTREQICGDKESCEKTFTYGGKEYKLVIKSAEDDPDMEAIYETSVNGKKIDLDGVDYLDGIYFTDNGLIAFKMSSYQFGEANAIGFYDTNLNLVKSYSSINSVEYDGGYSGKYFGCEVVGEKDDDQLFKTYEFSITKDNKFSEKKVSEVKQFCTAQN